MSTTDNKNLTVRVTRGAAIIGMLLTFIGGYFLGSLTSGPRSGPDLKESIKADREAVPVGLSPTLGKADALVTVVEFADYGCRYCARSVALQERMMAAYKGRVRWVYKNFPINPRSRSKVAAQAALAAHQQGEFWAYHDLLFHNQDKFGAGDFSAHANTLGLNLKVFRAGMSSAALGKVIDADVALGRKLGVNGTPTFFINGRKHLGSISHRLLRKLIDQELAYAHALVQGGLKPGEVYSKLTEEKPKPSKADEDADKAKDNS